MTQTEVSELFDFHLLVLKEIFLGKQFSEIKNEYSKQIAKLDYINISRKHNLLTFDENIENKLLGAYPVSPIKTSFKVEIEGLGIGYCMCAIDALGIAYTFNAKTKITSIDKSTNKELKIIMNPFTEQIESETAYYVTYKDPDKVKNIAQDQCPIINFYSDKKTITNTEDLVIFSFNDAVQHAKRIFNPESLKNSFFGEFKAIRKEDIE
jgi:hypothetical protein